MRTARRRGERKAGGRRKAAAIGIIRFVLKFVDLIEAEGRSLRSSTIRVGVAISLALGAALIGVAGVVMLAWGLYAWLREGVGAPGAAAICGALLLAVSTWTYLAVRRLAP